MKFEDTLAISKSGKLRVITFGDGVRLRRASGTEVVIRVVLFMFASALFALQVIDSRQFFLTLVLVATFRVAQPVSIGNMFLIYTYVLFAVAGPYFFPGRTDFLTDALMIQVTFAAGYRLGIASTSRRLSPPSPLRARPRLEAILRRTLYVTFGLGLLLLAANIRHFGLTGFYSGQAMTAAIEAYGKPSFVVGLSTVLTYGLQIVSIATAAFYVGVSLQNGTRPQYIPLILLFLVLPLLALQRAAFALGLILLVAIVSAGRQKSQRIYRQLAVGLVAVIIVGTVFGVMRERAITGSESLPFRERVMGMLASEFSPIVAYVEIKDNIDYLGFRHGETILLPLIFKPIPRSWFPTKPINSSAYYFSLLRPDLAAAGFALPPTFFGDLYLNFATAGMLIGTLLFSVIAGRLDERFRRRDLSIVPLYLIIFYYTYFILRNNVPDSIAMVIMSLCLFGAMRFLALLHESTVRSQVSR